LILAISNGNGNGNGLGLGRGCSRSTIATILKGRGKGCVCCHHQKSLSEIHGPRSHKRITSSTVAASSSAHGRISNQSISRFSRSVPDFVIVVFEVEKIAGFSLPVCAGARLKKHRMILISYRSPSPKESNPQRLNKNSGPGHER
jgi:hypothetical protein